MWTLWEPETAHFRVEIEATHGACPGLSPTSWFLSSWKGDSHNDHNHVVIKPRRKPHAQHWMGGQPWDPCAWTPPRACQQREQSSAVVGVLPAAHPMPSPSYPPSSKWLYFSLEFNKFSYRCDTWQAPPVLMEDPHVSNSLLTVTNPCQFQTDNFYLC